MKDALVIILYDHPLEHTSDYASQTSKYLSRQNFVIGLLLKDAQSLKEMLIQHHRFWLWKKQRDNCYVIKPFYIVPFRRFKTIVRINTVINMVLIRIVLLCISYRKHIKERYKWIYNPEQYFAMRWLGTSCDTIYDCVDYHNDNKEIQTETQLIRESDTVFVNSQTLYAVHKKIRSDIHLVPQGFDLDCFVLKHQKPHIRFSHNKPNIGYIGGINSRLDYQLLLDLIRRNARYNFVFVGPIQKHGTESAFEAIVKPKIDTLFHLPNVTYFPYISKRMIPDVIRQFDIGMIPYDSSKEFNIFCYPMKIFEYFYIGKPVVATPITELTRFPEYVKIGANAEQWERHIEVLLSKPWTASRMTAQRRLAVANSWEKKMTAIQSIIG